MLFNYLLLYQKSPLEISPNHFLNTPIDESSDKIIKRRRVALASFSKKQADVLAALAYFFFQSSKSLEC